MSQSSITNYFSKNLGLKNPSISNSEKIIPSANVSEAEEVLSDSELNQEEIAAEELSEHEVIGFLHSKVNLHLNQRPKKRRKESHKQPGGGYSKFLPEYADRYREQMIECSNKSNSHFYCKACDEHKFLSKNADRYIKEHVASTKHKQNVVTLNKNAPITSYIKKRTVRMKHACEQL